MVVVASARFTRQLRAELVALQSGDDGLQFGGRVAVDRLVWGHRDVSGGDLLKLDVRGLVAPDRGRIDLSEFSFSSRYAVLDASGRIDDPFGDRRIDLSGKLAPEYEAISQWLATNIEPGAKISGRPRSFRLRGDLGAAGSEPGRGDALGLALDGADIYGMKLGATAIVVRSRDGKPSIDPIDSTINEGALHLEPSIRARGESGPLAIVLGKGSTLKGARVNDEVSRRVLSFVRPSSTTRRGSAAGSRRRSIGPFFRSKRLRPAAGQPSRGRSSSRTSRSFPARSSTTSSPSSAARIGRA